jgi:hypothetical protein
MAHRLCAFSVARISNIVEAEWGELHLDADVPVWIIPRDKMKSQGRHHDHKIILSSTITDELMAWRRASSTDGYVFRSPAGGKHITRESVEKAYRVTLQPLRVTMASTVMSFEQRRPSGVEPRERIHHALQAIGARAVRLRTDHAFVGRLLELHKLILPLQQDRAFLHGIELGRRLKGLGRSERPPGIFQGLLKVHT